MPNSVYIHIPFCKTICTYCDFCKMYYHEKWIDKYLDALDNEVKKYYHNEKIKTLYIGGGTPSSLSIKELNKLFSIIDNFDLSILEEFTFECNLNDLNEEIISFLSSNKVNRLSIGIESFNEDNLKFMNRKASYDQAKNIINICHKYNIHNINIDLIYALKSETIDVLKDDLNKIISLNPSHISTYSLMIEKGSIIYNENVKPIDENLDYQMYEIILNTLKENGYNHYEISNFAKENYESKHNLVYWNNQHYYGFGLSASGYINNYRYENTKNLSSYLKNNYRYEEEILSKEDEKMYELILGFRKTKGIDIKEYEKKYQENILNISSIKKLISSKDLICSNGFIYVNPQKLYVENEILVKLI